MKHRGKISGQYATATKIKYSNRKSDKNSSRADFPNLTKMDQIVQNGLTMNYNMMVI